MSEYYTPPTGSGYQFPRSGQILAALVEIFGLRASIDATLEAAGFGAKTVQRYFAGDDAVSPDTKDQIRERVLRAIVPDDLGRLLELPDDVGHLARAAAGYVADRYDDVATRMNSEAFPVPDADLAVIPYLRLTALDGGIRWGAYQFLRQGQGREPEDAPSWLEPRALQRVIDRHRGKATIDQVAADLNVSKNALQAWRSDEAVPARDGNLEALAGVLAKYSGSASERVVLEVRLAAAGGAIRRFLDAKLGASRGDRERRKGFFVAFATTSRLTREHLALQAKLGDDTQDVIAYCRALVAMGGGAPRADMLCRELAQRAMSAWKKDVALDFAALPADWFDRLSRWAREVGPVDVAVEQAKKDPTIAEHMSDALLREVALGPLFDMAGFDRPVDTSNAVVIKNPPHVAAANRIQQAADAAELGDLEGALVHARRAVDLQPRSAAAHLALAWHLGNVVARGGLHALNEAIAECRRAYEIDPTQPVALNEVAVLLSNARLYSDAEEAYAKAAAACDGWAHHHFGRGLNLLALARIEDAKRCFERTLELAESHVAAKVRLAAVLHALGDAKGGQRWAKAARQDGHPDPLADVERWLTHGPIERSKRPS